MIQCRTLDLISPLIAIHEVLLGFVSGLGCDCLCCQDFRVSETRRYCFADLVYSF